MLASGVRMGQQSGLLQGQGLQPVPFCARFLGLAHCDFQSTSTIKKNIKIVEAETKLPFILLISEIKSTGNTYTVLKV